MRYALALLVIFVLAPSSTFAQSVAEKEAEIRASVPYYEMAVKIPGLTLQDYNRAVTDLARRELGLSQPAPSIPVYAPPTVSVPPPVYVRPYSVPTYVPPARSRSSSTPRAGTTYDWQSGNLYSWRKSTDGSTRVDGSNLYTGSIWNSTIKPNGSMRGTDSNLNMWDYNARTKTYINYGTGKFCVGEGSARICTP